MHAGAEAGESSTDKNQSLMTLSRCGWLMLNHANRFAGYTHPVRVESIEWPISLKERMKILIVEDEPVIAISLAFDLELSGHTIIGPVPSGAKALELAREHQPDIALVDIQLREIHEGVELTRSLKSNFNVPSIFLTGQREIAIENPDCALGVITKPYTTETVVGALEVAEDIIAGRPPRGRVPWFELFH
jgi:CheY-like chemotaxis protein